MKSWAEWKEQNRNKIVHKVGPYNETIEYESAFVDLVLSKVRGITPDDVIPQYHFIDDDGGNRYIDFMITNKPNGYCLPIELDGTYKDVNHVKWRDFLIRQNALITKFGVVLRFSNRQMEWESQAIIKKIEDTLQMQKDKKITEETKTQHREELLRHYSNKLQKMEKSKTASLEVSEQIKELREAIAYVNAKVSKNEKLNAQSVEPAKENNKNNKLNHIALISLAIALAFIIFVLSQSHNTEQTSRSEYRNPQPTSVNSNNSNTAQEPVTVSDSNVNNWQEKSAPSPQIATSPAPVVTSSNTILADQAKNHIGQHLIVCGIVAQIRHISSGTFINFDYAYPNATFTGVVWNSDIYNVTTNRDALTGYQHQKLCITGDITAYHNQPEIIIKSADQLSTN